LYIKNIPKHLTSTEVRRIFARFGKISSFSLVNKEQFSTNICYVGFMNPNHAKSAFETVKKEELENCEVFWHKNKANLKNQLLSDIQA